ncbi:MAG: mechanosensitive ion channel [Parachlamydiaceae bacterium]|nr:mechanosensitive ion channel [Parachlamydiaceae bacterium]
MSIAEYVDPFCYFGTCSAAALEGKYGPLIQAGVIILFFLIFNFIVKTLLLKLKDQINPSKHAWGWSFVAAIPKPLGYLVWYVALICSLDTISSGFFDVHLLKIHHLLSVGTVLAFGWFLLRWNAKVCHAFMEKSQNNGCKMTSGKLDMISKVATIGIIFLTLFLLLDVTGRSVQTLIAFGGIGGLALAFASQQMISNFFGGLMVYMTQPFMIGEWIVLPEKNIEGHIEEIGWYLTCIRNLEKRPIYVPNAIFTQTIVITPSRMTHERIKNIISLRHCDMTVVKVIVDEIKSMLLNHSSIDQHLKVEAYFSGFGQNGLEIEFSAYMSKASGGNFSALKQDIYFKIAEIVKKNHAQLSTPVNVIEIPGGVGVSVHHQEGMPLLMKR